jgi:hypothetical protein
VLGETKTAQRICQKLQARKEYIAAAIIAGMLGEQEAAIELMWQRKNSEEQLFRNFYQVIPENVTAYNPVAAYALMQALEQAGYETIWIAVSILDSLNSS